jgi:hypothetical protein
MEAPAATADNLKSVKQLIEERPDIDNTAVFARLREIQDALWAKVTNRFELEVDAGTLPLQPYQSLNGEAKGWLSAFTGPEMDWAVRSWIGNPARSFCNLHITLWLGPQIRVPHLTIACGTFPVVFFYLDYTARVDLRLQPEYLDRYHQAANERFLELQSDKRITPFISRSAFVRDVVSCVGLNFIAQPGTEGVVELFEENAHEMLDRWLGWVDEAEPVPPEERAALAAMDLTLRRNFAERDPANNVGEALFGKEMTEKLVRGLWGGDRVSPRNV